MKQFEFEVGIHASQDEIFEYFDSLDTNFLRKLKSQVDLESYLEKIYIKASKILLRKNDRIVAAMFFYSNTEGVYVSHVGVSKLFERNGYGKKIFEILQGQEKHKTISLEVDLDNQDAINFYETIGFKAKNRLESKLVMELLWK